MSLMGSLLPLLLFIPVVMVQGHPTLGTPVRGRGTLHQFGDSSMGAGEEEDSPGIPVCPSAAGSFQQGLSDPKSLWSYLLCKKRQVDIPLQRELSVVKLSRAGIVWLWLWGVSPRQGFVVVEQGFWFFGYQQLGNRVWQEPHSTWLRWLLLGRFGFQV